MGEVVYIKLSTRMFDDEKIKLIRLMPEADALMVIWVQLICQAGKVNDHGYIYITPDLPYNDEKLACILNQPLNTVRLALQTFAQFGMIEITDTGHISLTNWHKWQNEDALEKIRTDTRKRVARFRERHKALPSGNVTVTFGNETEEEEEEEEEKREKEKSALENLLEKKRYDEIMINNPGPPRTLRQAINVLSDEVTNDRIKNMLREEITKLGIDLKSL